MAVGGLVWEKLKAVGGEILSQLIGLLGLVIVFLLNKARKMFLAKTLATEVAAKKEEGISMQTVPVTFDVPKEGKEVVDALAALTKDLVAKKGISEITGDVLPKLLTAVDGFNGISEEVKSDKKDELAGYLVQQLMDALGI